MASLEMPIAWVMFRVQNHSPWAWEGVKKLSEQRARVVC